MRKKVTVYTDDGQAHERTVGSDAEARSYEQLPFRRSDVIATTTVDDD